MVISVHLAEVGHQSGRQQSRRQFELRLSTGRRRRRRPTNCAAAFSGGALPARCGVDTAAAREQSWRDGCEPRHPAGKSFLRSLPPPRTPSLHSRPRGPPHKGGAAARAQSTGRDAHAASRAQKPRLAATEAFLPRTRAANTQHLHSHALRPQQPTQAPDIDGAFRRLLALKAQPTGRPLPRKPSASSPRPALQARRRSGLPFPPPPSLPLSPARLKARHGAGSRRAEPDARVRSRPQGQGAPGPAGPVRGSGLRLAAVPQQDTCRRRQGEQVATRACASVGLQMGCVKVVAGNMSTGRPTGACPGAGASRCRSVLSGWGRRGGLIHARACVCLWVCVCGWRRTRGRRDADPRRIVAQRCTNRQPLPAKWIRWGRPAHPPPQGNACAP
eukprot:358811-Chlamydomonas_euryale.AAC.27